MYCISAIHFYDQTIDAIICSSYILIFKHYIDYHVYQSFLYCELQSIDTTTLALCFVHFLTFLHDWLCFNRPITVFILFGFPFLPSVISTWQDLNTELYLTFHLHSTYNATVFVCGCSVIQSCLTLCDPMDCSSPGSSVHGIFQAHILEWVALSFSRVSSQPRDQTCISGISCIDRQILYH